MTIITISGLPGTGKTTVAQLLEKKLGLPYVYSGEIFRALAKKYKMSLEEFGAYCETHREIDEELDRHQVELLKKGNLILEGRLSGWLAYQNHIPAMKVLLTADLQTRAGRVVKREEGALEKRKKEILKREKSEANRYKKYYRIDIKDTSIYNLIIDTGEKTPEEIADAIVQSISQ